MIFGAMYNVGFGKFIQGFFLKKSIFPFRLQRQQQPLLHPDPEVQRVEVCREQADQSQDKVSTVSLWKRFLESLFQTFSLIQPRRQEKESVLRAIEDKKCGTLDRNLNVCCHLELDTVRGRKSFPVCKRVSSFDAKRFFSKSH